MDTVILEIGNEQQQNFNLSYKNLLKDKYITLSGMNIIQNKIIKQQLFNDYLPKEIFINSQNNKYNDDSKMESFIKTPDPLQYMTVTKLELRPYNINIYQKVIEQIPVLMPNLQEFKIDYSCLIDDEGIEDKKDLLINFLSKNTQLQKLNLEFVQVVFQSQAVRRFADVVSQMQNLTHLSFYIYEHGANRQSIKYLLNKLLLLKNLESLQLDFWDEDPMPFKTAQKLFSHLKHFKIDFEEEDDISDEEDDEN